MRSCRVALALFLLFVASARAQVWTAQRVRLIGENDGVAFGRIAGMALSPEGKLFVLDGMESRVHVFAADGKLERSFGKSGAGPGELSASAAYLLLSRGQIVVADYGNGRVNLFDTNGAFLRSSNLSIMQGAPLSWVPLGDRVVWFQKPHSAQLAERLGGVTRPTILARDPRLDAAPDTLLQLELPPDNEISVGAAIKFKMNMSAPQLLLASDGANRLLVAQSDTYRVQVLDQTGKTTGWLTRNVARKRYSASELERMKQEADSSLGKAMLSGFAAAARMRPEGSRALPKPEIEIVLPEYEPAINNLLAGDRFVLVLRSAARTQPREWDILTYDGKLAGTVRLPARFTARVLRGDLVAGVEKDELDVESVAVYRIAPRR